VGDQDTVIERIQRFAEMVRKEEEAAADRVLATVRFTHIVDSTAQAAAMGVPAGG
jgi:hypothetical protein